MYWPPRFAANNVLTVSDLAYHIRTGNADRFAAFAQAATILSPWLSWAGVDVPWKQSDPMLRALLIGDPPARLFSFNDDLIGSTLQLGSPALGQQMFEVVSYFDWYEAPVVGKVGAMAWARLFRPLGPPAPAVVPVFRGAIGLGSGAGPFNFTSYADPYFGWTVFFLVFDQPTITAVIDLGGVPFTAEQQATPAGGNCSLIVVIPMVPTLAPGGYSVNVAPSVACNCIAYEYDMSGATWVIPVEFNQGLGGSPDETFTVPTPSGNYGVCGAFLTRGATGAPVIDAPFNTTLATSPVLGVDIGIGFADLAGNAAPFLPHAQCSTITVNDWVGFWLLFS